MSKVYIIQKVDWMYNDEYHYPNDGGTPVQAYKKKSKATQECQRLNLKKARDIGLGSYFCEDVGNMFEEINDDLLERMGLLRTHDDPGYLYDYDVPDSVSDKSLSKFLDKMGMNFFTIEKVDLGD